MEPAPASGPFQDVGGREFAASIPDGARGRNVAQGDVLVERVQVEIGRRQECEAETAEFRGKRQAAAALMIVERFDAEAVACQDQAATGAVPNRERDRKS